MEGTVFGRNVPLPHRVFGGIVVFEATPFEGLKGTRRTTTILGLKRHTHLDFLPAPLGKVSDEHDHWGCLGWPVTLYSRSFDCDHQECGNPTPLGFPLESTKRVSPLGFPLKSNGCP